MTRLIHVLHFRIGQCSNTVGAPVDNPAAFINQSFLIQRDEHFPNGVGAAFIHSKPCAIPVAGSTKLFLLLYDTVSIFLLPIPNLLQELFASQIISGETFLAQFLLHLDLCSNACMINPRNPQCIVALHPLKANQGILQRCIHSVAHVQLTSNVWRRHYDGKGLLALVPDGMEIATVYPHLIDSFLCLLGLVHLW